MAGDAARSASRPDLLPSLITPLTSRSTAGSPDEPPRNRQVTAVWLGQRDL